MNRIYCLHDNILDLLKKEIDNTDILTFDDGHYSVYKYRYILDDIDCKKILFVTPSYISMDRREEKPDMSIYYILQVNILQLFVQIYHKMFNFTYI